MVDIELELVSSLVTVALAILALVIFINHGASALFYATVVVAMAVGFLNAWLITKAAPGAMAKATAAAAAAKARMAVPKKRPGRKAKA
jgi:archaellum biogenesis protein FlaJ (TadC family)